MELSYFILTLWFHGGLEMYLVQGSGKTWEVKGNLFLLKITYINVYIASFLDICLLF